MSDENGPMDQKPDPDEIAAEIMRQVRRSESQRLAEIYDDILVQGARDKSPEQEDLEWQLAAKRDEVVKRGWLPLLKRGALFASFFVVWAPALGVTALLLSPQARHVITPQLTADITVGLMGLGVIAFMIGLFTGKD
jgi:hypothetical protein